MSTLTILYIFSIILLAAVLNTLTGFGFALVATPLLAFVINPKEAVVLVLFIGLLMKVYMVYKTWLDGKFARIALIFAASIVGALPGAYVLRVVDENTLKIVISIALILITLTMSANVKLTIRRHNLAKAAVGFISGLLGATTSFSGPPIVLYMMNEGMDKISMRADLVRYFLLGNTSTLIMAYLMGTFHISSLTVPVAVSIPALALGWWLGEKVFKLVDLVLFRRITLTLISISALVTLSSSF